jgi:signal transduction histidine kinase
MSGCTTLCENSEMTSFLAQVFDYFNSADLAPHGLCLLWRPELIWLHVASDSIIALSYFSIPIVLAVFASKRPDFGFGWVLFAFAVFITACGATHVFGIWTLWSPDYAAEGVVKGITAVASIATAIGLWPLLPKFLAFPSSEQLRLANLALKAEITQREAALRAFEQEKAERLKAQRQLDQLEQHREIERLVALTPDAVIVVNTDGIVQFINEAATMLFDKKTERFVGTSFGYPLTVGAVLQIQIPWRGQERTGEMRVVDCEWSGAPAHLVVVIDISERKRVERLKDDFVATVSHELRTPLTSISGSLGLLVGTAGDRLPASILRLITIAHTNCQRLVRLVSDILDVEKIESGDMLFDLKRVEARALVTQVIEASDGLAQEHGVRVRLDASPTVDVKADPDRLAQVMTNLLSNAIKFSPRDQEVTVAIAGTRDGVRISVRDRGAGIPEAFKPHVFDKFAQADVSDTRAKSGTGLGLSIVKQIVTRLGGRVWFEDAAGCGTIFHVELVRFQQPRDAAETTEWGAHMTAPICQGTNSRSP